MKHLFSLLIILSLYGQTNAQTGLIDPSIKTSKAIMDEFMDQRFGMFIHWGPVALRGTEIGWSRGKEVSFAEYDNLYQEFNPVLFDADKWAKTAKDAGMKYLTITAKHHDGFCLWPTEFSDFNIMNSLYKRDIVGELAEACKKYDIKFCVYFTVLDWHDPHYPLAITNAKEMKATGDMDKFVGTMKNQLTEIVTRYKPYMIWFDGNWESPWKDEYGIDIYGHLKKLDPNVIINNRLGANNSHPILDPEIIGDFATPEQRIGAMNMKDPWETCMTIAKQWAWKPNDQMKSKKECIQTLLRTAGGDGNLLFNVGPMPDGRIEQRQIDRLKEMGDWLKIHGAAVYGTRGGPYLPTDYMVSTRKDNKIYLHLFKKPDTSLTLPFPKAMKVEKAYFLKNGSPLDIAREQSSITINLPEILPDEEASVIVLELNRPTHDIAIIPRVNY